MNLLGTVIKHSGFGEGTILNHSGNYLVIAFAQGKKEFLYPNAFSKHITAVDPEIAAFIKTEVAEYEASEAAIQENIRLKRIAENNTLRDAIHKASATGKPKKKKVSKIVEKVSEEHKD